MYFTDDKNRIDKQLVKLCTAKQLLKFEFRVLISTVHVLNYTVQLLNSATSQLIQSVIKIDSEECLLL